MSHFLKRQIKSKMSGGDPEGSEGSAVRFWRPIFGWNRCVWQPKNVSSSKCFYIWRPFPNSC